MKNRRFFQPLKIEVDEAVTDGLVSNINSHKQRERREKFPNARGITVKKSWKCLFMLRVEL